MLLFVNNISIKIFEVTSLKSSVSNRYNHIINAENNKIDFRKLDGKILIQNATAHEILEFIDFAQDYDFRFVEKIDFAVENIFKVKYKIVNKLHFVKAAGGIVKNAKDQILMIKRLGLWDLPKGKAEKRELPKETAVREVEEECGVKVKINEKICTTWHTYQLKGRLNIKQTKWYALDLISDKFMAPQTDEGIEDLKWVTKEEAFLKLESSFSSISRVIKKYYE